MGNYRYQLERYRGRGTRHTCPQCHRKQSFTRYIDTHNNNIYISDNVGIIIPLNNTSLITPGRGRENVGRSKYIGKTTDRQSSTSPRHT